MCDYSVGRRARRAYGRISHKTKTLTGIVLATKREQDIRRHAVEAGNLWAGAIEEPARTLGGAHIRPGVAVDNIVAAPTQDDVATDGAGKDDVACTKLSVTWLGPVGSSPNA